MKRLGTLGEFVECLGSNLKLDENLVIRKRQRYYLLDEGMKSLISEDFFYAGIYLGKTKKGRFFPSFNLLRMIAEREANKITVDRKSEWLFICGRDIFKRGIAGVTGSMREGDYTLVMNEHGECLGFGRLLRSLDMKERGPVVENILDVGDFLRRES